MNTPPLSVTVIQKNGTTIDLQNDLKVVIRKILVGCGITTGNFTVNILAPSENTLPSRTVVIRTADVRSIQVRACGHKTGTWNVSLSGPNNLGVHNSITRKSPKRHFEYDEKHNIKKGLDQEAPAPTTAVTPIQPPTPTTTPTPPPTTATVIPQKTDRFSITKNPEDLVLTLSYIAEACDPNGRIGFKEVCRVVNQNFAEEGEEISEAKIRPGVTGVLVTKGYLTIVSSVPTVYTLSPSGIALLEQNGMIKDEVKAKYKTSPTVKPLNETVPTIPTTTTTDSPLQKGLGHLEAELARYENLTQGGVRLVEERNTLLTEEKVLTTKLQGLRARLGAIDIEIEKTATELTSLNGVRERYEKIMKLIAGE